MDIGRGLGGNAMFVSETSVFGFLLAVMLIFMDKFPGHCRLLLHFLWWRQFSTKVSYYIFGLSSGFSCVMRES